MEGMSGGFCLLYQDVQDVFLRIVKELWALHWHFMRAHFVKQMVHTVPVYPYSRMVIHFQMGVL